MSGTAHKVAPSCALLLCSECGFGLHVVGGLQLPGSCTQTISRLPMPRHLLKVLSLLDHRLRFQVTISVYLAGGDGGHRCVHRLRVELCARKSKFRVVEESLGRVVLPT